MLTSRTRVRPGLAVDHLAERNRHEVAALHRDHRGVAAAEEVLGGAVAQVAGVFHVHRHRIGAAQLVADVLRRNRRLDAELAEPRLHFGLQDLADVDFGESDVAVRVALDVVQLGEILGIEIEHEPFGNDRDAVAAAVAQTLEDGADERVDDGLDLDLAARRIPPG